MNIDHVIQDWNAVRYFLAVARAGSFLKAAKDLRSTQPTISRRIAQMEDRLGAKLFDRNNQGVSLTPVGRLIRDAAEAMESAALDIERSAAGIDREMRGMVTITATEGIGGYWLGPKLLAFQRKYPGLTINLDTSSETRDLASREADIALRFNVPDSPAFKVRKVGNLRMRPFAAKSYLREFGTPKRPGDFRHHYLIDYYPAPKGEIWERWREVGAKSKGIAYRSNSSTAVAYAVREGYGLALMPTYSGEYVANIEEIPIDFGPPLDIWVVTHEEIARSRRVRMTLDHIYRLFEVDRYKYFSP